MLATLCVAAGPTRQSSTGRRAAGRAFPRGAWERETQGIAFGL